MSQGVWFDNRCAGGLEKETEMYIHGLQEPPV